MTPNCTCVLKLSGGCLLHHCHRDAQSALTISNSPLSLPLGPLGLDSSPLSWSSFIIALAVSADAVPVLGTQPYPSLPARVSVVPLPPVSGRWGPGSLAPAGSGQPSAQLNDGSDRPVQNSWVQMSPASLVSHSHLLLCLVLSKGAVQSRDVSYTCRKDPGARSTWRTSDSDSS